MAKKQIRAQFIKDLVDDKNSLTKVLEESTKDSLSTLLEEKVNRQLRDILAESAKEDSFEVEEVENDEPVFDAETKEDDVDNDVSDNDTPEADVDQESGNDEGECANGTCCDDSEGDEVWDEVEDCKDEEGEYDLRGKDINTVLKVLQSMEEGDGIRIIKKDDGTATVEPENGEQEFEIDIEDGAAEPNEFEGEIDNDTMDSEDGIDFDFDEGDEMVDDIDIDSYEDVDSDNDNDDETTFELEIGSDDDYDDYDDDENMMNEGNVNLGYTDNYQKKTPMTLPSDKGEGEGDSRFDDGAPKGGANNKKRWVGSNGANGGNPYTQKTKQPMSEDVDECGNECDVMDETHTRGMARKHNSVGRVEVPNTNVQSDEEDTRNIYVGAAQRRNTSRNTNESKISAITRQANAILAENKELKAIAAQIKDKLNEAVVINSSLSKIIKLMTENSTTRDEKINILNRFNKVSSLNESRALYNQISGELKNAHSVNNNLINNQLTEVKSENKNMIVETNMLNQSEDLKQILDLQKRLMNL